MTDSTVYPRFSKNLLLEAIEDTPVILIHGSRQCGKTTLAIEFGQQYGYHYLSFDDDIQREAAQSDPVGFVQHLPELTILDEVQRVPDLFTAIKISVDRNRKPGRFILTGSANVLLLPKLADSLAGRMEIIRLRPLAHVELADQPPQFLQQLFAADFSPAASQYPRLGERLANLITSGGYPAALARTSEKRRSNWYRNYITTLVQRDVRDLARIQKLEVLPRLLTLAAGQTARLFNAADMASPFSISRPTIREYLTLLEQVFLIELLAPWHSNRLSRLIKTPKLHLADTGFSCALLGITRKALWQDRALLGQLLETYIYQELRKHAGWHEQSLNFYHFRNKDGVEVDIVIEQGSQIAGVEVKAAATVTAGDFKGLKKLKDATSGAFAGGVVFYDGESIVPFGDKLFAVPISLLTPAPMSKG
ncbi:MAG: ATP-binding protein [Candidatus Sedimenticola sp. (ex Thyasira tokunagai)]